MPKLTNWSINSIYKKLRVDYSNTSGKFPETPLALLKIRFFESLMLKGCLKEQNIVLNPKIHPKEIESIQNHSILQHSNTQSSKRSVKKINPGDINHFHKKSRKNLTDEDQRRKILRMGIDLFPNHGALYKVLGELEMKHGSHSQARELFTRGLEQDPYYAPVYHAAALLEAKSGNLEVIILYI